MINALTITLLPEPVAPAISRCGILARSTACTRAYHVAPEGEGQRRARGLEVDLLEDHRGATMLKSLLGISMPTALLPGIGASILASRPRAPSPGRPTGPQSG